MKRYPHLIFVASLLLVWIIMILFVNPIGDFPINDDWTYGTSVKYMLQTGHFRVVNTFTATGITQIFWGVLFCLPFGFSYTALRISTLVLGGIGVVFLYFLAYKISANKRFSFFAALLLAINPMYFSLSNSFMTDVPFIALVTISCWFFCKAFTHENTLHLVLAVLFSILATLVRQFGFVLPLAYSLVMLLNKRNGYKNWLRIIFPPILVGGILFWYMKWMKENNPLFDPYQGGQGMHTFFVDLGGFLFRIFIRTGDTLYYCGFFLLPLLLLSVPNAFRLMDKKQKRTAILGTLVFVPSTIRVWSGLPIGNILNKEGIGPKLLKDTYLFNINNPGIPDMWLKVLISVGLIGALFAALSLVMAIIKSVKSVKEKNISPDNLQTTFLIFFLLGYSFLIFTPFNFFDRYTLPLFFVLALLSLPKEATGTKVVYKCISVIMAACIAFFTICSTHDYLSFQRVRWQALAYLNNEMKIPASNIDGGYEYNGMELGSSVHPSYGKSWWYVINDDYEVSCGPVPTYKTIKQFNYPTYMSFGTKSVYIVQKEK
jgi:4-amino-4-deoxy-L-arabinose transferase-like glycosyltransferase